MTFLNFLASPPTEVRVRKRQHRTITGGGVNNGAFAVEWLGILNPKLFFIIIMWYFILLTIMKMVFSMNDSLVILRNPIDEVKLSIKLLKERKRICP